MITIVGEEGNWTVNSSVGDDDHLLESIDVVLFLVRAFRFYPNRSSMILHWSAVKLNSFPRGKNDEGIGETDRQRSIALPEQFH